MDDVKYPLPETDECWVAEKAENPVRDKSFEFALSIIELCKRLRIQKEWVISDQLLKAGTSIGANVEEAIAAQSRKDFLSKLSIASKEARESKYWLRLLDQSNLIPKQDLNPYLNDATELINILTAIVKTTANSIK